MAGNDCPSLIQGCALRVARLDATGATPAGPTNAYCASGLVKLDIKDVIQAGNEIIVPNACGGVDVDFKVPDFIRRVDLTLEVTACDPELSEILTGSSLLTTGGNTKGFAYPAAGGPNTYPGVTLEVYVKRVRGSQQLATLPWGRWTLPFCLLTPSDRTIDGQASPNVFVGQGFENANYGNGPFNDFSYTPSGRVVALDWLGSIPTTQCGYIATPTQT